MCLLADLANTVSTVNHPASYSCCSTVFYRFVRNGMYINFPANFKCYVISIFQVSNRICFSTDGYLGSADECLSEHHRFCTQARVFVCLVTDAS